MGSISTSLAAVGVEHVIPESLGGKDATCRLIRHGIVVPEGPLAGSVFKLPGLSDDEIPQTSVYLKISFSGFSTLRLEYQANTPVDDGKKKKK